jgi:hypothetical protein
VGRPVLFTAVVLCLGFSVLGFSEIGSARTFGVLTSFALMGSLVAAVLTVPATVIIMDERFGSRRREAAKGDDAIAA